MLSPCQVGVTIQYEHEGTTYLPPPMGFCPSVIISGSGLGSLTVLDNYKNSANMTPMGAKKSTTVGAIQFGDDAWAQIEGHRARLQARVAGVHITMVDTVRDLVLIGLHAAEHDETKADQS
jgi:hypothetical protein